MAIRLGELLLREKRVTPAQLQEALNYQKANGGRLAASLVKLGILRDEDITSILSRQYGVPSINLTEYDLDPAIVRLVPGDTATKHHLERRDHNRLHHRPARRAGCCVRDGDSRRGREVLREVEQRVEQLDGWRWRRGREQGRRPGVKGARGLR